MKAQDPQKVKQFLELAVELGLKVYASFSEGSGYYHIEKHDDSDDYYFYSVDTRYYKSFRVDEEEVEKGLLRVDGVDFRYEG